MIDLIKHEKGSTLSQDNVPNQKDTENATNEQIPNTPESDIEPQPGEESVHGWLAFFLFTVGLGGLLTLVVNLANINMDDYANNYLLASSTVLTGIGFFVLACYTIYAFIKKKPNALFLARAYIILIFISNVISLISGGGNDGIGLGSSYQMIRSLIWGIIWLVYLHESYQVEDIFPYEYRKVMVKDWIIVSSIILVPIICVVLGLATIGLGSLSKNTSAGLSGTKSIENYYERHNQNNVFTVSDCSENEITDGRVIFMRPIGQFESPDTMAYIDESTPLYQYYNSKTEITICSGWEQNFNKTTFEQYWNGWKKQNIESYNVRIISDKAINVNGNEGFCKRVNISSRDIYVNWEFVLLHNANTDKIFLLSYYTNQKPSSKLVYGILNSVKFEKNY